MAKKKTKTAKTATPAKGLTTLQQDIIFPVAIAILLVFLLKPMVIDGLSPQGVDVVASIGTNNQVKEFQEETGETALWNPYLFAGMPRYQRLNPVAFSVDNVLHFLGRFTNNVFIFYLFAGLGGYFLLRWLNMRPLIAFLGSLAFILMPHYKSLYLEGHYTKFRALMLLPWVTFSFLYFLKKRTLFSMALFALAFGLQIRTQHYQIVFYTGLLIFSIGIYPVIKDALEKNYQKFGRSALLVIAAVILAIMSAAQPLFNAREYLPYSKRGKTTINLNQPQQQSAAAPSDGVTMEYATQWSTAPEEILTWFVPRVFGGMSSEKYDGDEIPRLKGQAIPGYWGSMPFTQSYEYMGVLTLMLALIGFLFNRKKPLIIALSIFALFLVMLSLGRHMSWFYSLFFNYVPFFNKFRAPMMSVTVTSFIISLLAAYGLQALYNLFSNKGEENKAEKLIYIALGAFVGLGIIIFLYGQGASFVKAGENYAANVSAMISQARQEMFMDDLLRYFLIVLASGGLIFAYFKKKLTFTPLIIALIVITLVDLIGIRERVSKDYIDRAKLERNYFRATPADRFLEQDKELFRVLPLQGFKDNRAAYRHQTIGGYTPIKMYTIEEIVENSIFAGWDERLPINWNVLEFLNVKYIISPQPLPHPKLQQAFKNEQQKEYVYFFKDFNKRAFFVGNSVVVEDEYERLRLINSPEFDADSMAVLERPLAKNISTPDSSSVSVVEFNPNLLKLEVYTDSQSLLVISELFYPPGWHLYLDEKEQPVYKTNHALQSLVVPHGKHTLALRFEPASYYRNVAYASISLGIIYLIIAWTLLSTVLRQRKKAE